MSPIVLEAIETQNSQSVAPLLDAAVAGAILARDPGDRTLRREAALAWRWLEPALSDHVASEEEMTSRRVGSERVLPQPLLDGVRERLARLRLLATTVAGVDFDRAGDTEVRRGARALCAIAVDLDDLIDRDETQLLPILQRSLFTHVLPK